MKEQLRNHYEQKAMAKTHLFTLSHFGKTNEGRLRKRLYLTGITIGLIVTISWIIL